MAVVLRVTQKTQWLCFR